jgi:hypothetical protein
VLCPSWQDCQRQQITQDHQQRQWQRQLQGGCRGSGAKGTRPILEPPRAPATSAARTSWRQQPLLQASLVAATC